MPLDNQDNDKQNKLAEFIRNYGLTPQQVQGQQPPVTQNPQEKAQSDAAYQRVLQGFAGQQPSMTNVPQQEAPKDTTEISPDIQDQLDKEQQAKQLALQQMMGNQGPRGLK